MAASSQEPTDINLILLGESGIEKSILINSFCDYFQHDSVNKVLANKLEVLIPCKFEVTDANYDQQTVVLRDLGDSYKYLKDETGSMQDIKIYSFPFEIKSRKYQLRFIDAPGIADAEQDNDNYKRILEFISQQKEIHGFCLLLNPANAHLDVFLSYCIAQLFSRLEASAVNNIFFVFANSWGESFSPEKTFAPLKVLVQKYKENNINIPLGKPNLFCFDNQWFRFAGASKNGVEVDEFMQSATEQSYQKSFKELRRMMEYAVGLNPHALRKDRSMNDPELMDYEFIDENKLTSQRIDFPVATPPDEPKYINILLLGESGVGKSTFINSCYNYFQHDSLKHVLDNKLEVLIPAKFEITDANFERQSVELGEIAGNVNECFEDAAAATQDVKSYIFPVEVKGKMYKLRLMDTPGIGDQRGAERDKYNCERILNFISQLKEIHGFCLLLKPSSARLDVFMSYCITQLLSRLEASAVDNIFFVFTNSRGENFSPGKTFTPLKVLVQNYKKHNNINIPLERKNIFCLDNEGFRYAGAIKNGVVMDEYILSATEQSWERSSKELWRMIEYAVDIPPHDLHKTMLVNESKMMVAELSRPLSEIVSIIQQNVRSIETNQKELNDASLTFEELNQKMHLPRYELRVTETKRRQTVCNHADCVEIHQVNGIAKTHYKKICCEDCLGTKWWCNAFRRNGYTCKFCRHSYHVHSQHRHKTQVICKQMDESMMPKVNSQSGVVKAKKEYLELLETMKREYEEERHFILETCAIIKMFLKANSIMPTTDPMEEYLSYQLGSGPEERILESRKLLEEYTKMKKELETIVVEDRQIEPEEIKRRKEQLVTLKHCGGQIKDIFTVKEALQNEPVEDAEIEVNLKLSSRLKKIFKKWF